MMVDSEKVRENKVRRMAERQGLALKKSRRRDPRAIDYGSYMLVDPHNNTLIYGGDFATGGFPDLDQIEDWLSQDFDEQYPVKTIETPVSEIPLPDIEGNMVDLAMKLVGAIAPEWPERQVRWVSYDIAFEIVQPVVEEVLYDCMDSIKEELNRQAQDRTDKVAKKLLEQV